MDRIHVAAKMAGEWWANRLSEKYADKRDEFAAEVARLCEERMKEDVCPGRQSSCFIECDYDPRGLLLSAVRNVLDPECRGFLFSAQGILPEKHSLRVCEDKLIPKEGYGNWTDEIKVPNLS